MPVVLRIRIEKKKSGGAVMSPHLFFDTGAGAAKFHLGRTGTCGETKRASRQSRVENSDMGVDAQELRG